ncbi:hypothetical protein BKA62DRAFT_684971 [Auriculariales sp. MPI-PUGE-AT-0066]|nr:hypothetical protein BKA62DRAFT_684971 [Auriculariales sp. MPI-PUGE-AT-0066]
MLSSAARSHFSNHSPSSLKRKADRSPSPITPKREHPPPPIDLSTPAPRPRRTMATRSRSMPPRPEVKFPLALVAFSHESVGTADSPIGKRRYLERIGRTAVTFAITRLVFARTDRSEQENNEECAFLLHDENLADWAKDYNFTEFRVLPNDFNKDDHNLNNADLAKAFLAYAGAVDVEHGPERVTQWIAQIYHAPSNEPLPIERPVSPPLSQRGHWAFQPPPPLPLPHHAYGSPPPSQNRSAKSWSATVNEHAQQKRRVLAFNASSSGAAHQLTWTVDITVDGQHCAQGSGNSKPAAKEEASRIACQRLGWSQ